MANKISKTKKEKISKDDLIVIAIASFFFVYILLSFFPPVLMKLGYDELAMHIYKIYSFFCHQRAERSLFLFGENATYSISQLNELGHTHLLDYRQLFGNSEIGYKVALCFRDIGIYSAVTLVGVFNIIRPSKTPLSTMLLILGVLPIVLDGGTQLLSEIIYYANWNPLNLDFLSKETPFYISTNLKRVLTGSLFGVTISMWLFPSIRKDFS